MRITVEDGWMIDQKEQDYKAVWITLGTMELILRHSDAEQLAKKLAKVLAEEDA